MQLIKTTKILIGLAILFSGFLLSVDGSFQNGFKINVQSAHARVGRPATPASAAGVHRRHVRRAYYNNNYNH